MKQLRPLGVRGDVALAGLVAVSFLLEIAVEERFSSDRSISVVAALAFAGALALRRRLPLLGLGLGVCLIVVSNAAAPAFADTPSFLLAATIAVYSSGRYAKGRALLAGGLLVLVAIPVAAVEPGQPFNVADASFIAIFFIGALGAGLILSRRDERERFLEGRTATLEVEGDAKARAAVSEERARIARELHDVVAHAISVMVLQARGGRRVLREDPVQALEVLDTIEHVGDQALAEMRRLLGLLRAGDDELALAPQPSLARMDELVRRLTASGLPVEVTVEGEPRELPPGVDVSAYRIVQEALTNALKHAGPARAHVILRYAPNDLELEILDDGKGNGHDGGTGHGLAGIRERVAVYGGEVNAGRLAEGGFRLHARLPLGSPR